MKIHEIRFNGEPLEVYEAEEAEKVEMLMHQERKRRYGKYTIKTLRGLLMAEQQKNEALRQGLDEAIEMINKLILKEYDKSL